MANIIVLLIILFYLFCLFYWNKYIDWRLDEKISKRIKYSHYIGLFICILITIHYTIYDIGLRGIWTSRIIIIYTLTTGIFFTFLSDKNILKKIEKIYFKAFSFFPVLISTFLLVPFWGILVVFSLLGQLILPYEKIIYEDKHLRIQNSFSGIMAGSSFDIFEKRIIFEKHLYKKINKDCDSLDVHYDKDSTRILLYNTDNDTVRIEKICMIKINNNR